MALSPGTRLGPHEIIAPLGSGGMGEVYRAKDTNLGREVAIKLLPDSVAGNGAALARFEREARAVAALSHPNILGIYDFGNQDGVAYAVMELLEGETLRERLASGPLPMRKAVEYAREVARGLAAAHEKGIVHRDLKPENVFVTRDGRVKILDFGLAKREAAAETEGDTSATVSRPTDPGTVLGTVGYMSPEQVRGLPADHRSDIFSFGTLLYEMLSGRRAFRRNTAADTMSAILHEDPPELSESDRKIPPALDRVVRHCLEKNPDERFQSARDVAFDLDSVAGDTGPRASRLLTLGRRPGIRTVLLGSALLGIPVAAIVARRTARAPEPTFQRMTFRRGTITAARFAPDGQTVVYSAAWDGRPYQLFSMRIGSPESTAASLDDAGLFAISRSGEMAVQLHPRHAGAWLYAGTLARAPITGLAPREMLEATVWADWLPDGSGLAAVRDEAGRMRLEFPIGTVVHETGGWISHMRVSPGGDRVAFIDHRARNDDAGAVVVVDRAGRKTTLSDGWISVRGLAWQPDGREVWFTATRAGLSAALFAVSLSGRERLVYRAPKALRVLDVSQDGRALLAQEEGRMGIFAPAPGEAGDRDLSFLDWSLPRDLSADGARLLFDESGDGGRPNASAYLRTTDGSPPVRLGDGSALSLSADGKWVLSLLTAGSGRLVLLPTGAGEVRPIPREPLDYFQIGALLPDGKRIVFGAAEPGHAVRLYAQDLAGGKPTVFSPEGIAVGYLPVSSDGRTVAARGGDGLPRLYPVDGGEPRTVPGTDAGDWPSRFAADGSALYVFRRGEVPCRVFRVALDSGRRDLVTELKPADAAGVENINRVLITPDGKHYAYSVLRTLSDLYLAEGLQ